MKPRNPGVCRFQFTLPVPSNRQNALTLGTLAHFRHLRHSENSIYNLLQSKTVLVMHGAMRRRIRKKLLYQLLSYMLPLLVFSAAATGGVLSWNNARYFQKNIKRNYSHILISSAGEIELFMTNALRGLESLALVMAAGKLDDWHQKMALSAFVSNNEEFDFLTLVSPSGEPIATTQIDGFGPIALDEETFRVALSDRVSASRIMVSDRSLPFIHLAVPVVRLGETTAVLWGELNLKSVWDVLEGIAIGKTGRIFILDLSGRYIGHPDISRVIRGASSYRADILKQLPVSNEPISWVETGDGSRMFCMGVYLQSQDWVVILEQDAYEIYGFLYESLYWAVGITLVILGVGAYIGWCRMWRVLSPIHELHEQALRLGRGEMDTYVNISREDEVGDLGRAFNSMTDSLKGYIRREIETANELAHNRNLALLGVASSKVTHEVGNLLNVMGLVLKPLKSESLSAIGHKRLSLLEKEADRLQAFISDFLQFARKPVLQSRTASFGLTVQEIIFAHQPGANESGIELKLDWPETIPPLTADHRMLGRAIDNLVVNGMAAVGRAPCSAGSVARPARPGAT